MTKITKIQAGQYAVDDGRFIVKNRSSWIVVDTNGSHDFGPVPTLAAAKQYAVDGKIQLGKHNLSTKHGRKQSKKEFHAYLASEANNGNPWPTILWLFFIFIIGGIALAIRGY